MIKFTATNKWYELAAKSEAGISAISAGPSLAMPAFLGGEVDLKKDTRELRKLEGFSTLLRMLRLEKNLTIEKLASKLDVDADELLLLERQVGYKASPRTLIVLAEFYGIPKQNFLILIGAIKNQNRYIEEEMIRFAAESESFEKLNNDEKRLLNRIVGVINKTKV